MPEIPDIGINKINTVQVHSWTVLPPVVNTIEVPVTVNIGTPIVLMPGCVESHPLSNRSNSIQKDDQNGVKTYCDSNAPSFTPLDYSPQDLIYTVETPAPAYKPQPPEVPATPELPTNLPKPNPPITQSTQEPPAEPVEPVLENVTTQPVEPKATLIDFLPTPQQVTTTASIAIVATSAALLAKPLADLLLKLIKPTVKKAQKKLLDALGKKTKTESVRERVLAQRDRNRAILALRRALKK